MGPSTAGNWLAKKNAWLWTVQLAVSLSIVGAILFMCDGSRLASLIVRAHIGSLVLSFLGSIAAIVLGAMALIVIVDGEKSVGSCAEFVLRYGSVQIVSVVTPLQTGDLLMLFVGGPGHASMLSIAAGILCQRIVGVCLAMIIAGGCAITWHEMPHKAAIVWAITPILLVLLGSTVVVAVVENSIILRTSLVGGVVRAIRRIVIDRPRTFILHIGIMCFRFSVAVAASAAAFWAFDVSVSLAQLSGIVAIASLAALIPISLGGIGVTDGLMVLLLVQCGFNKDALVAACVVGRVINIFALATFPMALVLGGFCRKRGATLSRPTAR